MEERKATSQRRKNAKINPGFSLRLCVFAGVILILVSFIPPITRSTKTDVLLSQPLTVRWRYESAVTLNLTPAYDNERIYLPLSSGAIVALKAKDRQLYWRSEMGGELSASPVADDVSIYVASETVGQPNAPAGALRALGREGGVTQWMTPLVRPLRGALTLSGGKLFAGGSDGRAYAFDKHSGGVLWSIPFALVFAGQPVVKDGKVYLGSEDGTLLVLDEATGSLLWRYRTQGAIHGPVAVTKDRVFFGSGDGYIYALSVEKGRMKWRKRTGAGVESVVLTDDALLAASLDNFAYLLNLKGKMLWKKLLPGRISAQPLTVQETALFTPLSSSAGVVLGLKDGKQVNSLPTGEELTSSASPIIVGDAVILTIEHGLLAFARPTDSISKPNPN
ncbi:MAG TPA: PQQ-binding-like beta-propeller repeat protein [Pyrinomonadaceae bacterium]|nr:PQQ-binding-like beta-propeller repeat protein [Pyrinomonadaceae bacterium]